MKKVLVATDKPFAKTASDQIRNLITGAGFECQFLEKYPDQQALIQAMPEVEAVIIRSDIIDARIQRLLAGLGVVA